MITELPKNHIFVFGSNAAGNHLGGAAKTAHEKFGAIMGFGEGLFNQSYALPTLNYDMERDYDALCQAVENFIDCAKRNPKLIFHLTKVGVGIAGYDEYYLKPLFKDSPDNVIKPKGW